MLSINMRPSALVNSRRLHVSACCTFRRPCLASQRINTVNARRLTRRQAASEDAPAAPDIYDVVDRVRAGLLGESETDREEMMGVVDDLEKEMQTLKAAEAEASQLQASLATSKDQLLRLTADFDNYRRRTAQQTALTAENSKGDVMKQLLPIIDGFEQARTQVKAETEGEQKINNSYQGLYKQMVELLRNLGVEPVPTVGTPFDPEIHEAIMREASSEHPEGTVLVEFRKGFRLGEKLLRPAMVQVSFRDDDAPSSPSEEASDE